MSSENWTSLREALLALFEVSTLGEIFEARAIEGYSGDPPKGIYVSLLKDSQLMIVLFSDDIRPGVKDEIETALADGKPIVAFREKGKKLSATDEQFVKDKLYPATTVEQYSSVKDLFEKIRKSLVGLVVRRLNARLEAEKLTDFVGASMKETTPGTDMLLSFASFAAQTAQNERVVPLISEAVKANPMDDDLFLAKMGLTTTAYRPIELTKEDADRLLALARNDERAAFVLAALKFSTRYEKLLASADLSKWLKKDSPQWKAVKKFAEFSVEGKPEHTVKEVAATFQGIKRTVQVLDKIEVAGIKIFSPAGSQMESHVQKVSVELSEENIPGVPCCLNCMPRDSGEFVILSKELGSLRDLLDEKLYDEYPGPEWSEYEFSGLNATCGHCGTELDGSDDVYEDYHDHHDQEDDS